MKRHPANKDYDDPWQKLADNVDVLEMLIEEETAYAENAEILIGELEDRGYI